jgi:hypothetical protein
MCSSTACRGSGDLALVHLHRRRAHHRASFAIDTFEITASAGEHGTITPSGVIAVSYGATPSFAIAAATGYEYRRQILVDGQSVARSRNTLSRA